MTGGQDKASEKAFYESLFRRRKRFDQFQRSIYQEIAREARARTEGTLALELGCGSGDQAVCLIESGFQVLACDLSYQAARIARGTVIESGAQSFLTMNADAEHVPVPDAAFDACVCGLLLHHFGDLSFVAREIRRVLKPGGVVVAIDANAHNPFAWLFLNAVHRMRPLKGLTPNQRALWRSEIVKVFAAEGFGDFHFRSMTSELKRDWLGKGLGARLNFQTRAAVLGASRLVLPQISQGNMLLSVFQLGASS